VGGQRAEAPTTGILVVGGVGVDYVVHGGSACGPGESTNGDAFLEAPGGKGGNQAVAIVRLGGRATLVACVGQDARGDRLLERLEAEGVDTRHLVRAAAAPSGVTLIHVHDQGRKRSYAAPGANRCLDRSHIRAASETIRSAHGVLAQLEVPLDSVSEAFRIARDAGVRTFLDPAPATKLSEPFLQLVDVIRPNAHEAEVLTGIRVHDRASARRAAGWLLERGIGLVAVEAGHGGNLIVWQGGEHWQPRIPVETIDVTGAGDAFAAALCGALAEGRPIPDAAAFANAAAALATTKLGAQPSLPQRDAIMALMNRG